MPLWHSRDEELSAGALIQPGRWGQILAANGPHDPFFLREQMLERYRIERTAIAVSRLACCFAFEDREYAADWTRDDGAFLYEVVAANPKESGLRLDALWLTWMGEPGSSFEINLERCRDYWSGRSTQDLNPAARPTWEWLFSGGLRVIRREPI